LEKLCRVVAPLKGGPKLRWGIVGPGGIASAFVETLLKNTDQSIVAVASRSLSRAERFAREFSIEHVHTDYDAMFDSDIDVVYVANINAHHVAVALRAIAAGKHVLVEKPLGVDASEVREVQRAAQEAGVVAMEAMWTRYLPAYVELFHQLRDGAIGDVRLAGVEIGWRSEVGDGSQIWEQGGGVTLDRGVYGFWLACSAIGWPTRIAVLGSTNEGVDSQVVAALQSHNGRSAAVSLTLDGTTSGHAELVGTLGRAEIAGHVVFAEGFDLVRGQRRDRWTDCSGLVAREGLAWQAAALALVVTERCEPLHTLEDSLRLAELMDVTRALVAEGGGVAQIG